MLRILLLNDGRPGHWRQVTALAQRLGGTHEQLDVQLLAPWRWLAPRNLPLGLMAHRALRRALPHTPPRAIISCGRRSALVLQWLRRYWVAEPLTVQILHCGLDPGRFDWLITPRHDRIGGSNVLRTLGSLNPVDDAWLAQAPKDTIMNWPAPRLVVLLGGPARHFRLTRAWLRQWLDDIAGSVSALGGSVQVIASPRSPPWVRKELAVRLGSGTQARAQNGAATESRTESGEGLICRLIHWNAVPGGRDEYRSALASATHLAVTADSVNLLSEACATGRPVLVLGADRVRGRIARFVRTLIAEGYARDGRELARTLRCGWRPRRLRETPAVAIRLMRSGLSDGSIG